MKASRAFRPANLNFLKVRSSKTLKPLAGVIEQKRPCEALTLGLRIHKRNFHIFVSGPPGTGKTTTSMRLVREAAKKRTVPNDLVYVHNFTVNEEPSAIQLEPGDAAPFKRAMTEFVRNLRRDMPDAYHRKEHQEQIQAVLNGGMELENESFVHLKEQAAEHGFIVRTNKQGITVLPVIDDKPLSQKEYAEQPKHVRADIERRRKELDPLLSAFFEFTREVEKDTKKQIQELQKGMGTLVIQNHMEPIAPFAEKYTKVAGFLEDVSDNILSNLERFLPDDGDDEQSREAFAKTYPEYEVNVVVNNVDLKGAPVIVEDRPTFYNLFGRIEKKVEYGIYSTDHTMIQAGAMIRANGGYLVINAEDLLNQPGVWTTLKACLRNRKVRIEDLGEAHGFLPTSGIRPEHVPSDVKVLLVGNHSIYDLLYRSDDDFSKLFRVKAEFDDTVIRNRRTERAYAQFIAGVCERDELLPITLRGLEALVEMGSVWCDSQNKLSLRFNELASLIIESDDLARQRKANKIERADIKEALERRDFHISLLRDQFFDELEKSHVFLECEGLEIGKINALSVYEDGPHVFGKPARISARAQSGSGGLLNIEREAGLSGHIHDKAVMILAGYLGGQYGILTSMSADLSLCFEQSYGYVDGDSASLAELLVILSELAQAPLRQDIAVTGSINQFGEVQPVGGVTAKIHGFHRLCAMRGLTGTQGVAFPASNIQDIMLSETVRNDMESGKFHLYPIHEADQAIALLLESKPGVRYDKGYRPANSIHSKVLAKLRELHDLSESRSSEPSRNESQRLTGDSVTASAKRRRSSKRR